MYGAIGMVPTSLLPEIDFASLAWEMVGDRWLLSGARLVGLTLTLPFFSSRLLPLRFRLAVVTVLQGVILSGYTGVRTSVALETSGAALPFLVFAEVVVGVAIGWSCLLVVAGIRAAAMLISEQVGFAFGGLLDPEAQQDEPVLRGLYAGLAVFIFLATDAHHALLHAVSESLWLLPPGTVAADGFVSGLGRLTVVVGALLFESTLMVVFPIAGVLLLSSVAQGVLTRLFPEIETVFFGFLLRTLLALGVVTTTLPLFSDTTQRLFENAVNEGHSVIRDFTG